MRTLIIVLGCAVLLGGTAHSQPTFGERIKAATISAVAFSAFDYVGYNIAAKHGTKWVTIYHGLQTGVLIGLSYWLYDHYDLKTMLSFNVLWLTFNCDLLFYVIDEIVAPQNKAFKNTVFGNKVSWAYWTPIGILRGFNRARPIAGNTLLVQAVAGQILSVSIAL